MNQEDEDPLKIGPKDTNFVACVKLMRRFAVQHELKRDHVSRLAPHGGQTLLLRAPSRNRH